MRFVIWAPNWVHNSAGVQVLHKLCHQLNEAGYNACITGAPKPGWNETIFDGNLKDDDFVIYPEIIRGNPMQAKHVIRYMLYYPWHHFGNDRIPENELCIPFAKFLYWDCQRNTDYPITEQHILELSIIEPELFFVDPKIEKTLCTYWVSKCDVKTLERFPLPAGATIIHHGYSRADVAKLLQQSHTFICFDVNTAMMYEADFCGAEVFLVSVTNQVIPWKGYSAERNKEIYYDKTRIHNFVHLVKSFFKWEK